MKRVTMVALIVLTAVAANTFGQDDLSPKERLRQAKLEQTEKGRAILAKERRDAANALRIGVNAKWESIATKKIIRQWSQDDGGASAIQVYSTIEYQRKDGSNWPLDASNVAFPNAQVSVTDGGKVLRISGPEHILEYYMQQWVIGNFNGKHKEWTKADRDEVAKFAKGKPGAK